MKHKILPLCFFFIFTSCASTSSNINNVVSQNQEDVICEKVSVAGSRLPKIVCYEKGMKEEIAKKSKEALKREQNRNRVRINSPSE